MEKDIIEQARQQLFYQNAEKAYELLESNAKTIDFEDDDEIEKLIELLNRAFTYSDDDHQNEGELGIRILDLCMKNGFDINFKMLKKECLILKLMDWGWIKPEIFQQIVDRGADVYSESSNGEGVLMRISEKTTDEAEELAIYIAEHFDLSRLDRPNRCGLTPLMYSVINNKPRLAKTLIEHGSDVNATGGQSNFYWMKTYGVSAFALACRAGNAEIAKMLMDAGADDSLRDAEGIPASFSLFFYPFRFDDLSFMSQDKIIAQKAEIVPLLKNIEATDSKGNTPLLKSLSYYDYSTDKKVKPRQTGDIIRALIARGANVNAVNNEGTKPLHLAAEYFDELLKDLLAAEADINAQDGNGDTALTISCTNSDEKTARWLLRKGADFRLQNNDGKSAMDLAAENGLTDILELMI